MALLGLVMTPWAFAQQQFIDVTASHLPVDTSNTQALALGDVDRDGDLDLVAGNAAQNRLYLNDGTGIFRDVTATNMPADNDNTAAVAMGDVDGDGDPDLVIGNRGQSRLYLNDGGGKFTDLTAVRMPPRVIGTNAVVLGDVDADNDPDLILGNSGQSLLYLNDGAGKFTDATSTNMPALWGATLALGLGDVDGDNDLDLVIGNSGGVAGSPNFLYLNDGAGVFRDVTGTNMPSVWRATTGVALGDIDGDADNDVICGNLEDQNWFGEQNYVYTNNGAGSFSASPLTPVHRTAAVALADMDEDGDLDVVFGNQPEDPSTCIAQCEGQTRLYVNDGLGAFFEVTGSRLPVDDESTQALVVGDIDGDGDPDIVTGNGDDGGGFGVSDPQNRVYLNLHRQLSAPAPPALSHTHVIELHAKPGYGTATHIGAAILGLGLAPTPLSLPPWGDFYLALSPLAALPSTTIPQATGKGYLRLPIPGNTGLIGVALFFQALILNSANSADTHFTGYIVGVIQ